MAVGLEQQEQYYSIFSYINSLDSNLISLELNTKLILSNYIKTELIENNIFGVYLYGIKILKLPKNIGVYYFSQNKNIIISENEILEPNDIFFCLWLWKFNKGYSKYTIEMVGVVEESAYEVNNKYILNILKIMEVKWKNLII